LIAQRLFEYEEEKKDEDKNNKDRIIDNLLNKKEYVKIVNKIETIAYSNNGLWIGMLIL